MMKLKKLFCDIKTRCHLYSAISKFHKLEHGFADLHIFKDPKINFWFNFYLIISTYVAIHIGVKGDEVAESSLVLFGVHFKKLCDNKGDKR